MITDYSNKLLEIEKESKSKLDEILKFISDKKLQLSQLDKQIIHQEQQIEKTANFISSTLSEKIDRTLFSDFLKKPYKIKQINSKKYEIYVPKWVPDFQVGWLVDDDGAWFTYEVNQYSAWLGDIPHDIADKLNLQSSFEATVENNKVSFDENQKHQAEQMFKGHILKWDLDHAIIKSDHEFDIILKIIQSGHIPYKQNPINKEDRRRTDCSFELRQYQKEAIKQFEKTGAIGVFHPTGAGKSFVAMHGMDMIKGKKLLVTTKTLIGQWEVYFEKNCPRLLQETDIVTYELFRNRPQYLQEKYSVAVFDECHKLPAKSFAKLALVQSKYRIGLSASPHREDGNEDMIFALTGYPVGLNWKSYMEGTEEKLSSNLHSYCKIQRSKNQES